jgi:putative transcriptional regulator
MVRIALVVLIAMVVVGPRAGADVADDAVKGKLLVATDEMPDPRFAQTVIYIVEHGPEGAIGVVLNRPIKSLPLGEVLHDFGVEADDASTLPILAGGPVYLDQGFVLHTADYSVPDTRVVDGGVAFTPGIAPLIDSAKGKGPAKMEFFVGLASWGPGQLEDELMRPGWIVVPGDADFVFDENTDTKWQRALAREGIDL